MKNTSFIIIIFLILALCVVCTELQAQTGEPRLFDVLKEWPQKKIIVKDGLIYKYTLPADTARRFDPGADQYEVTVTFKKKGVVDPPPIPEREVKQFDSEEGTVYSSNWTIHTTTLAANWYKSTISYSTVAGSTATFTFFGEKIELFAEVKSTHGSGRISIDGGPEEIVSFKNAVQQLPVLIFTKENLENKNHTIKLTAVGDGPAMLDFYKVYSIKGTNPQGSIINVLPGENLKNKIEGAPIGTTVRIADAVFSSPTISVPVGVNIECGQSTVITCTTPGSWSPGAPEVGLFNFKSIAPVSEIQTVKGCILEGNDIAFAGAVIENRTVKFDGTKFKNFNFTGAWFRFSNDSYVINSEFHNTAWSSNSFLSGAVNLFFTTNFTCANNKFTSNKDNKGTAIESLWKKSGAIENVLTNTKILNSSFILSHQNPWSNGQSQNFAIELHDTHYRGLEISGCYTENEFSLSSHRTGNGQKTWVHHNTGDLKGDNFFIEAVLDDLHAEFNNIKGAKMLSANMQENFKWKNHRYNNNTFESSGKLDWGAIFLFGKSGVSNYLIDGNTIKLNGNILTKWMGADKTGVTVGSNGITQ